jgi:membrane protease YdiL (CAAX protease family)
MIKNSLRLSELKMDSRVVATLVISTLLIVIDHYTAIFPEKWMDHFFLYLVIPVLAVKWFYHQPLREFGFRIGDWKIGLGFCLIGWIFLAGVMYFVAVTPDFKAYYAGNTDSPFVTSLKVAADLFGWEFVFRGWLLFSLFPLCGPYAIIIQAIPFTIAHFGKPEFETLSCIFGGAAYGYIAWRTRSFYYPFLIHWFLTTITILFSRLP